MAGDHLFISYARADGAYVRRLAAWLRRGGVEIWMDDEVPTSERWHDRH